MKKLSTGIYFGEQLRQERVSGLILTEKTHAINQQLPEHFHENAYFCLALNGGWQEVVNGKQYQCTTHDLVYHPAGEVHRTTFTKTAITKTFNIELSQKWIEKLNPLLGDAFLKRNLSKVTKGQSSILRIYKEFIINDTYSHLAIEGALVEKVTQMARYNSLPATTSCSDWLEEIKQIIEGTYQTPLSLQELSKQVQLHPAQLSRDFRKKIGFTISEYYRKYRLEQACILLKDTRLALVEVALEVGYYDQSHMCRDFHTYLQITPLQYLKNHRY